MIGTASMGLMTPTAQLEVFRRVTASLALSTGPRDRLGAQIGSFFMLLDGWA
jgi:hypothetical protein